MRVRVGGWGGGCFMGGGGWRGQGGAGGCRVQELCEEGDGNELS